MFGPPQNSAVSSTARSLASGRVPHQTFSGREANRRYPQQLKLPEDYTCVFEEGGGILNAQRAVLAFQVQTVFFSSFPFSLSFSSLVLE